MADTLSTITNLINSPPGVLVAGGVLAGIVWKFFDKVDEKLNDDTKLEIAIWLVGRKSLKHKAQNWPIAFLATFDRLFTKNHFTLRCFFRSALSSLLFLAFVLILDTLLPFGRSLLLVSIEHSDFIPFWQAVLPFLIITNVFPDYISLLETRLLLRIMARSQKTVVHVMLLVADAAVTIFTLSVSSVLGTSLKSALLFIYENPIEHPWSVLWQISKGLLLHFPRFYSGFISDAFNSENRLLYVYAGCFTSIWLWLYALSGFLLKAAHQFDIGFQWFNRRFDIEKKPLSSIGLVAGALVALVYWAAVIVSRVV
jgi:hypothetical protein